MKPLYFICLIFFCLYDALAANPPSIQLASPYRNTVDISQFFVSEKLDGMRGYWDGRELISRGGHPINAPEFFTKGWPATPMDGELWIARGKFQTLMSIVRKQKPLDAEWKTVRFMIFDLPSNTEVFSERVTAMEFLVEKTSSPYLAQIRQFRLADNKALQITFDDVVKDGGEGLMLHRQNALYQIGRSQQIMKLKPFDDDDAMVIGHIEGKGKFRGKLGAILVRTDDGKEFKIGNGFSHKERENPPPIGAIISFKFSGKTDAGIPRFASYLRIRQLTQEN